MELPADDQSEGVSSNFRLKTLDSFNSNEDPSSFTMSFQGSSAEKQFKKTGPISVSEKKKAFSDQRSVTVEVLTTAKVKKSK